MKMTMTMTLVVQCGLKTLSSHMVENNFFHVFVLPDNCLQSSWFVFIVRASTSNNTKCGITQLVAGT